MRAPSVMTGYALSPAATARPRGGQRLRCVFGGFAG